MLFKKMLLPVSTL